jgi:hypothetical protein
VQPIHVDKGDLSQAPLAREDPAERAKRSLQVAGAMLVATALLSGVAIAALPGETMGSPFALVIDCVIGISLLRGDPKYKGFAIFRVVAGLVVYGGMSVVQGDLATLVIQGALSGALLLLLIGVPTPLRMRLGVAACVAVLALLVLGIVGVRLLPAMVAGETSAPRGGVVRGVDVPYTIHAGAMRVRDRATARTENPSADNWLVDLGRDEHVLVVCLGGAGGGAVDVSSYAAGVTAELTATGGAAASVSQGPAAPHNDAMRAIVTATGMPGGVNYEVQTYARGSDACAVYGFAMASTWADAQPRLAQVLSSFRFD